MFKVKCTLFPYGHTSTYNNTVMYTLCISKWNILILAKYFSLIETGNEQSWRQYQPKDAIEDVFSQDKSCIIRSRRPCLVLNFTHLLGTPSLTKMFIASKDWIQTIKVYYWTYVSMFCHVLTFIAVRHPINFDPRLIFYFTLWCGGKLKHRFGAMHCVVSFKANVTAITSITVTQGLNLI